MNTDIRELLLGSKRLNELKKPQKSPNEIEGGPDISREKPKEMK